MFKSRYFLNIVKSNYSNAINAIGLKYSERGDPLKVIYQNEFKIEEKLKDNEVLIKFLSAAIHPADINIIQGQYPIKHQLPAIGGYEGYAQVIDAGTSSVLKEGDFVITKDMSVGTWSTHQICKDFQLTKVPRALSPHIGAILAVNPGTAYRMLKDFTLLNPGDVIIQNGGTSSVAIFTTQLAKLWGLHSISIIRDRQTIEDTLIVKNVLQKEYGATFVLTEQEIKTKLPEVISQTGTAKLGLNCLGGKGVLPLFKALKQSGVIVTYGGMNRLPMQVPVSPLIFSDIRIRGFWMTSWKLNQLNAQASEEMIHELCDAFHSEHIKPSPLNQFDFSTQWKEALSQTVFGDDIPKNLKRKNIFLMNM